MFEDIKKNIPILENQDELIKVVLQVRETFNAKDVPFKITVGNQSVGNVDKYLDKILKSKIPKPKPRRTYGRYNPRR